MSHSSRYGRLRYGVGRYGGSSGTGLPPVRQPAALAQPGTRPLAVTSALGVVGLAVPGGQPGAVMPATRVPVLPRAGTRAPDSTPGTGAD